MNYFLQGLTMGLVYIIPIGIQNLFVINTALKYDIRRVLITALSVCFFDIILSLSCFFGMGMLIEQYSWLKIIILFIGGLLIIFIGVKLIKDKKTNTVEYKSVQQPLYKSIIASFIVTWCNPQALIDGTIVLGAFHAAVPSEYRLFFITGIMLASFIWFLGLSISISFFRKNFKPDFLRIINIICGSVMIFYGIKLLLFIKK